MSSASFSVVQHVTVNLEAEPMLNQGVAQRSLEVAGRPWTPYRPREASEMLDGVRVKMLEPCRLFRFEVKP